jgi:Domain of unknown function (DUF4062)
MKNRPELIRVFLASPGDVALEREAARRVIDETQRTVAPALGIRIEIVGWDTHAFPAFGGDPQSLINQQIAEMAEYDLFVGILWNRIGTPTPRAKSGTEEEFHRAVEAFESRGQPQIMLYFSQAPMNFTTADAIEQKGKVIEFREGLRNKALVWSYADAAGFECDFREHFQRWLTSGRSSTPAPPIISSPKENMGSSAPEIIPSAASLSWLLLNNRFFRCESLSERQDGSIVAKLPHSGSANEALLRSFQVRERWQRQAVSYAFEDDGGFVDVKSAERESQGGRTVWTLVLHLDRDSRPNAFSEIGFNNISADDLAVMRARLLLLNEAPEDRQGRSSGGTLRSFVAGLNIPVQVTEGIFPDLWKQFAGEREHFISLARLWAVFHLKASNTVEHILALELGPISGNQMHVRFRGQRHQVYTNEEPETISIDGECRLD